LLRFKLGFHFCGFVLDLASTQEINNKSKQWSFSRCLHQMTVLLAVAFAVDEVCVLLYCHARQLLVHDKDLRQTRSRSLSSFKHVRLAVAQFF